MIEPKDRERFTIRASAQSVDALRELRRRLQILQPDGEIVTMGEALEFAVGSASVALDQKPKERRK